MSVMFVRADRSRTRLLSLPPPLSVCVSRLLASAMLPPRWVYPSRPQDWPALCPDLQLIPQSGGEERSGGGLLGVPTCRRARSRPRRIDKRINCHSGAGSWMIASI